MIIYKVLYARYNILHRLVFRYSNINLFDTVCVLTLGVLLWIYLVVMIQN